MINRFILFVAMAATGATLFSCAGENISVNLHVEWALALDTKDRGIEENMYVALNK